MSSMQAFQTQIKQATCPFCEASPGVLCKSITKRKTLRVTHTARLMKAKELGFLNNKPKPTPSQPMINQRIPFRLIHMECCGHMLCWVNPRFPTYCPECSKCVYPQIRGWVTMSDSNAHLRFKGLPGL